MAANGSQNQDAPNQGGLYKHVKMSVRSANILVGVLLAALVIVIVFVAINNGFKVSFDTDGGSRADAVEAMYGDLLVEPETPVKEGYVFTGWYRDIDCTVEWDFALDKVEGDLTLYAGWDEKNE